MPGVGWICLVVKDPGGGVAQTCAPGDVAASGRLWGLFGTADGRQVVYGLAPDDAETVTVVDAAGHHSNQISHGFYAVPARRATRLIVTGPDLEARIALPEARDLAG